MKRSWSERGSAAVDVGDLVTAKQCFARAVKEESRNARHRLHLAIVLEGLGELAATGRELTEALRLDPGLDDAARRLAALLRRAEFSAADHAQLDTRGLRNALHHKRIDQKAIANAAVECLRARQPLRQALAAAGAQGWAEAARILCQRRTAGLLKDDLLLDLLRTSLLSSSDLEHLLTALRRVLLMEIPPERFADSALTGFTVALMQQCWINEFVWVADEEEERHLAMHPVAVEKLAEGDAGELRRLLTHCLYRPAGEVLGGSASPEIVAGIEPAALRETLGRRLAAERDERERARGLSRLGVIAEETSRKVAQFYEASPYPRWSGMVVQRNYRATLAHFLGRDATAFMGQPFEVLIAGCGTGLQAIQSAINYGPGARMLAIDLSAASLGYAARMAETFGVGNIEFAQADLQQIDTFGPQFAGRFQLIEAVGVLHHMADPFAGWRALLKCLAPGGLMRLGLYSATARRSLAALRGEAGFPGPGCGEEALRSYRRTLLDREDPPARDARKFVDFWDAKSFRDLLLHVTEHTLELAQIAAFLAAEGLEFRGFQLPKASQAAFFQRYPRETWPGSLETWAKFEEEAPSLFENMYLFWCERRDAAGAPA